MRRPYLLLLPAIVMASAAPPARGYIGNVSFPTVEVTIARARTVVLGRLVPSAAKPTDEQVAWTVEVSERLRGKADVRTIEIRAAAGGGATWQAIADRGGRVAVCADMNDPADYLFGGFSPSTGGYAVTATRQVVYDLTGPPVMMAYSMDLRRLQTASELEAAIRRAAAFDGPALSGSATNWPYAAIPLGWADAEMRPDFRSELLLPIDARLDALARQWMRADRTELRRVAVTALAAIQTPQAVAALKEMLRDTSYRVEPARWWERRIEYRARRWYDVRNDARYALLARGVGVAADVEGPDAPYEPVAWGWPIALAVVVVGVTVVTGRRRWGRGLACGSLVLLTAVGGIGWRSASVQDCASLATASGEYEVTSVGGRVSWLRVDSRAAPRPWLARARPRPPGDDGGAWFGPLLDPPATVTGLPGVRRSTGMTVMPPPQSATADTVPYPYEWVQVRYAVLAGAFAAWPAVHFAAAARRALRRRRWRRSNRCADCGYDLRGAPSARCPECGKEKPE